MISRTIVPIRWTGSVVPGVDEAFGLGDVVQSFFFTPQETVGGWILCAGPVFLLPTATDSAFQGRQFGLGPTAVALRQHDGFTYGALVNHVWGVTNPDTRANVNQTFLQPFFSYTWPTSTTLAVNVESSYNWNTNEWTVPIIADVGQLVSIGVQKVQFRFGGRFFPTTPSGDPDWGVRFQITFLFPK